MKKSLLLLTITGSVFMFSGCATLFGGGGEQTIAINANSEKRVPISVSYADGEFIEKTYAPATISVERKHSDIIIKPLNDKCQKKVVKKKFNKTTYWNILGFPGGMLLSSTTDASTGAMWKYDKSVNIHCSK